MTFLTTLFDTFIAPVLAALTATAQTVAANIVAAADWTTAHPALALGAPLALTGALTLVTRLESRRSTARRGPRR